MIKAEKEKDGVRVEIKTDDAVDAFRQLVAILKLVDKSHHEELREVLNCFLEATRKGEAEMGGNK